MQQKNTAATQAKSMEVIDESASAIITNVLDDAGAYATELVQFLPLTAGVFRSGDEGKALGQFIDILTGLDSLVKTFDSVGKAMNLDFGTTVNGNRSLREYVDQLNELLREMMGAQQKKDWVLLADLLEYELAPGLNQWLGVLSTLKGMLPAA